MSYTPYIWVLIPTFILNVGLVYYGWRQREQRGARPYMALMAAAALWALTNLFQVVSVGLTTQLFWANLRWLSLAVFPLAWLVLALEYTLHDWWLNARRLVWLTAVPVLTVLLAWTDGLHGWIRSAVLLRPAGSLMLLVSEYGPWFWLFVAYGYGLLAAAFLLCWDVLTRTSGKARLAPLLLVGGSLAAMSWLVWLIPAVNPLTGLILAPVLLAVMGAMLSRALFASGPFDVVPVARALVMEKMQDGLIVLDGQGRIVDVNGAAQDLLDEVVITDSRGHLLTWMELLELCSASKLRHIELRFGEGSDSRYIDLTVTNLKNGHNRDLGYLLSLHDITKRKLIEQTLRSESITDPLTGLPNRRRFFEVLKLEIARARRYNTPLSLLMVDLDSLKSINDTYGHALGDQALQRVAGVLRRVSRETDLPARYAGDEFMLLLPNTPLEGAHQLARRALQTARQVRLEKAGPLSVSLGVAVLRQEDDRDGEALVTRADEAMYLDKQFAQRLREERQRREVSLAPMEIQG